MCGGIWMTKSDVTKGLANQTDKTKLEMLKMQLKARKFVFNDKNENGILNFSEKGRAKSWEELKDQVLVLITTSQERARLVEEEDREIVEALCAPDEK